MAIAVVPEGMDDLWDEWLGLLGGHRADTVFLHPVWQRVWLKEFAGAREPLLLSIREDGRLLGIAPLLRDGSHLSFVGDHNICDYMDVVLAPGREGAALTALADWLVGQEWDEIELRGLAAGTPSLSLLPSLVRDRRLNVAVEPEAVCPQLELPSDWEAYLAQLTKKNRHELRRKLRRLEAATLDVRLVGIRQPSEVASAMDDFLRLMTLRSDKARFMTPQMERFFRRVAAALAEIGLIALYVLEVDGRRAAAALCFEDSEDLLLYNSGYDPALSHLAVGLLSKALLLRNAIETGKRRFDFLRGNEPYKYDLGGRDGEVFRCLIKRA